MADLLRLGVIGANASRGWASRVHMPALSAMPQYELRAVCTSRRESAEASAEKFRAPRAYWSYRELLADPDIDVVDICVPWWVKSSKAPIMGGPELWQKRRDRPRPSPLPLRWGRGKSAQWQLITAS